ncbi:MAG: GGDEF domain-containing protein [Thomasclavelia sp.]|nr:GGDEF domain-containing protein [Thomasclavelia sp.]
MISHYSAIVFISSIMMLMMILCVQVNVFLQTNQKRRFQLLFLIIIIANMSEWGAAFLNGTNLSLIGLHFILKLTEFILTPIVPILCIRAFDVTKHKIFSAPIIFNLILQSISLFSGVVFSIDKFNVYHRGPLYLLYVFTFVFSIILLLVYCYKFSSKYQHSNMGFFLMMILLTGLVALMQIQFPYLRLDWTCISILAMMLYIYYYQLVQQVDNMTGLLNRRSYDCLITSFNKPSTILFFDVDRFKEINDSYGHEYGDKSLIKIAKLMQKVFNGPGYSYRYGGDEFCVIMLEDRDKVKEYISRYNKLIEEERKKDPQLPYVSIGYTIFDPDKENISNAIRRADRMMYIYKEIHHKQW